MISRKLYLPENYTSALSLNETQKAITVVKDAFQKHLSAELNLARVSAPLFVRPETGLNDDLSGFLSKTSNFIIFSRLAEYAYGLDRSKLKGAKPYGVCEV